MGPMTCLFCDGGVCMRDSGASWIQGLRLCRGVSDLLIPTVVTDITTQNVPECVQGVSLVLSMQVHRLNTRRVLHGPGESGMYSGSVGE